MCNPLHCFHVSVMSFNLQFVKPCSKVRSLRWTGLEDGIWVWLFLHNGGMGQECGSKPVLLVRAPYSKWWNLLMSVRAAPDLLGWGSLLCRPSQECWKSLWAGRGLEDCWGTLAGLSWDWEKLLLCQQNFTLWGRMCVALPGLYSEDDGVVFKNNIFLIWNKSRQRVRQLETDILFSHFSRELYFQNCSIKVHSGIKTVKGVWLS